jgi:WD40 repeat protein
MRLWDATTGRELAALRPEAGKDFPTPNLLPMFFMPGGKEVLAIDPDGVRLWDAATGREHQWLIKAKQIRRAVALSPDGKALAVGGKIDPYRGVRDTAIRLYDLTSGRESVALVGHETSTQALAFAPDGRTLASASGQWNSPKDRTVRIWDVTTGRELRQFAGHRGPVTALSFAADGRGLVSAGSDGTALVWELTTPTRPTR